jgi:hypothetical protein
VIRRRSARRLDVNARGWFKRRGKSYGRRGVARKIRGRRRFTRPTKATYRRRRFAANPPARRHRRKSRRSHRNPQYSYRRRSHRGGRRSFRLLDNPLKAVTDVFKQAFTGETLETVFHTALGFGGTAIGSRLIIKKVIPSLGESGVGRVGATLGVGLLGGALLGAVGGAKLGARAVVGGLLATAWQVLTEVLPASAKEFIPTLGQDAETESFRKAIEAEVVRELRGGGAGDDQWAVGGDSMSVYIPAAGVNEVYLQPAGQSTYLTSQEAIRTDRAGMTSYLTQGDVERSEAGMGTYEGEFSAESMPERF